MPNLTVKSKIALTANPIVDVAATTGHKGAVFGLSAAYDSKAGALSSWTAAAGYTALDYQVPPPPKHTHTHILPFFLLSLPAPCAPCGVEAVVVVVTFGRPTLPSPVKRISDEMAVVFPTVTVCCIAVVPVDFEASTVLSIKHL